MITELNTAQANAIDVMSRSFDDVYTGGLSQFFNDILSTLAGGVWGVQSEAADIDAVCLGGGEFTYNVGSSSGLTLAYNAGRFHDGYQAVNVSAGTISLAASSANYIELDNQGVIHTNTTAFTQGRMPLMTAITSTSAITSVTNNRAILCLIGPGGVTGLLQSTPAATKSVTKDVSSIAATASFTFMAPVTGMITAAMFNSGTAVTTNNTNYWSFSVTNLGQVGTGTTPILAAGAANTTQATGGTAIAAFTPLALTLNSTGGNLNCNQNDVIEVTVTAAGSPTAMGPCSFRFDVLNQN